MDSAKPNIPHSAIAERAFLLWEQTGRPHGRDLEFWLRAEYSLTIEHARDATERDMPPAEDVPGRQLPPESDRPEGGPGKPGAKGRGGRKP